MPHVRIWPGGDGQPSSLPGPDPHVRDPNILNTIYALAIKHRMDEVGSAIDPDDEENPAEKTPVLRKLKKKAESSALAALQAHPT
ncbi:hypothetical protein PMI09_00808 [Rhizobium sp. CF122]|uniref:hypothetical protein n=1 Tax=Rhizobium sp. CF122 TaxID=1144312 RepID=UPI000271B9DC|nr:hypothetical protein [Rhizobium sp. CF122]EJL57833.1 hypothetical protein PMI09_00808 [Rhizobium sp. CF122]